MSLMTKSMLKILGNVKNFARKIIYVFFGPTIAISQNVGFIQEMLLSILISVLFVHEAQDIVKVCMHICLVQKSFFYIMIFQFNPCNGMGILKLVDVS